MLEGYKLPCRSHSKYLVDINEMLAKILNCTCCTTVPMQQHGLLSLYNMMHCITLGIWKRILYITLYISVLHGGHCGNKQKFHILSVNMSIHCQVLNHLFAVLAATEWDTCKSLVSVCTWLSSASASGHRGKHKSETRNWDYQWNAVIVVVVVL